MSLLAKSVGVSLRFAFGAALVVAIEFLQYRQHFQESKHVFGFVAAHADPRLNLTCVPQDWPAFRVDAAEVERAVLGLALPKTKATTPQDQGDHSSHEQNNTHSRGKFFAALSLNANLGVPNF